MTTSGGVYAHGSNNGYLLMEADRHVAGDHHTAGGLNTVDGYAYCFFSFRPNCLPTGTKASFPYQLDEPTCGSAREVDSINPRIQY